MFLDTDIAYDPDDIVTAVLAAATIENLIVVTADEIGGRRARVARRVLDLFGRDDVPVITGLGLDSGDHRIVVDGPAAPTWAERTDLVAGIAQACAAAQGRARWIGCGPMRNLATVLSVEPHLADVLTVTQMGGWYRPARYRNPHRASHNFHVDMQSAGLALRATRRDRTRLVLSEHTAVDELHITEESPLYRQLAASTMPWAQLVTENFDKWFAYQQGRGKAAGSWMHDPLTLAAALELPCITFRTERLRIGADARLFPDPNGLDIQVSDTVDYPAVVQWITDILTSAL
ncbi:nucleoside hydrolase [Nocardia sp. alder85J]|uniref:nucleoside hydrolase n=1 Tax=Nocardia sp. alder85J TaxID=2862949 RepID=UPI001CD1A995|nr:nucleoside hydrolase [Nocardia sp. alder85J]MCX4094570.1 nucleoside hydrolase [Nocardia sp. alder85J]